jgi:hypothetical protein
MLNSIVDAERQYDSLISGILEKLDIEIDDDTGTKAPDEKKASKAVVAKAIAQEVYETMFGKVIDLVQPLVPVEWGQGMPFNDNLEHRGCIDKKNGNIKNNGKVLAGCVAVAAAQIMSYWEHPPKIGNYSFDWAGLNNNKKYYNFDEAPSLKIQVANLMQQIGKGVGMNYGCDGSGARVESAMRFLSKLGFKTMESSLINDMNPSLVNYNSDNAIASIKRREPLIVRGCSKKINHKFLGFTVYTSYEGCHAWVIDGYLKRRVTSGSISFDAEYIHSNWGWNGDSNGYFTSGVFNSTLDPDDFIATTRSSEPSESIEESGEDNNYQYEIQMTPYIRR